jgi:hypothetical protein
VGLSSPLFPRAPLLVPNNIQNISRTQNANQQKKKKKKKKKKKERRKERKKEEREKPNSLIKKWDIELN